MLRHADRSFPVLSVTLLSCVSFLVTSNNAIEVFDWFVGLTSAGLIINETATYVVVVAAKAVVFGVTTVVVVVAVFGTTFVPGTVV